MSDGGEVGGASEGLLGGMQHPARHACKAPLQFERENGRGVGLVPSTDNKLPERVRR